MSTDKLSNAFRELPAELQPAAARLLSQIAHDLQSPLSTLSMEVFSIRMLLDQPERPSPRPGERNETLSANLSAISANMERASAQLADYLNCLASLEASSEHAAQRAHDPDHPDRRR